MGDLDRPGIARRNLGLYRVYIVSQFTPLYWAYMYHLVTQVRGLSATEYGLLKSIYYFSVVLLEFPLGVLADRMGRKGALILGAACNSLGCVLYVVASGFWTFAAGELCFGLATAFVSGASSALLYDSLETESRQLEYPRIEGQTRAATLLAGTLGYLLTDLLLVRGGDPMLAYAATAGLSGLGLICALAMMEPPRREGTGVRHIVVGAFRDLRHVPEIAWLLLYSGALFVLMRSANSLFFNPVLARSGVPVNLYGTVLAGVGLLGAVGAWRTHDLLRLAGRTATLAVLPLSLTAMYLLLVPMQGPEAVAVLSVHGLAMGAFPVVVLALLNDLIPSSTRRATLLSLESLVARGLYGVAVLLIGRGLDTAELTTVLAATAAVGCVPLALVPLLRRRLR